MAESEEEIFGDGGERFEKVEMEGFQIKRPKKDLEYRRKRKEHYPHRTKGCKLGGDEVEEQITDKEDSKNSNFCTPSSQPTCSPDRHPRLTRRIHRHLDSNNCISLNRTLETRKYRQQRNQDEEKVEYDKHRNREPNSGRASAHTRLDYAKRIVEPEEEYGEEEDHDEEENGYETFEALTVEEALIISGSSESLTNVDQTYGDQKTKYRGIVEKLIKRTGILCKDDMDKLQQKMLRRKIVSDFRRQTAPRPHEYNAGGTLE